MNMRLLTSSLVAFAALPFVAPAAGWTGGEPVNYGVEKHPHLRPNR